MKAHDVVDSLLSARRVSTPIVAIATPDQMALTRRIAEKVNGGAPKFTWDVVRGLLALNDEGQAVLRKVGDGNVSETIGNPMAALVLMLHRDANGAEVFPEKTLLIMLNAHRFTQDVAVLQALQNLRDHFCQNFRTVVLLGPHFDLTAEYSDVVSLDESLPDDQQLGSIVDELYRSHVERVVPDDERASAIDTVRGLSAFAAEQVLAMSLRQSGIDMESAWEMKRQAVNKTKGLRFVRGGHTFDDLGGLDNFKGFVKRALSGPKRPGCVVFFDEIEKAIAGAGTDTSGVSDDALQTLLTWMENGGHTGMIAVGMPGTGKTAGGMAIGASFDIPTVVVDLGAMRGSLVGASEQALREALKVIDSIAGQSGAYIYATCNKEVSLPGALKRRFKDGEWYFALPSAEERESIWRIHLKAYGLDESQPRPNDESWTGAEIRNCCEGAWRLSCTLLEAAAYVVPVVVSSRESLDQLERQATMRWLSASYPGPYRGAAAAPEQKSASAPKARRAMQVS